MSIICLASLKGGVGKTSLAVNLSHGFAQRGCHTLLIDLDPSGHASRFFRRVTGSKAMRHDSPLARMFLPRELHGEGGHDGNGVCYENAADVVPTQTVRPDFDLLPSGHELKHFLWGRGAQIFARRFSGLMRDLGLQYDHIVIDTPPDFNVLTRNAIACSDLVTVPVDASEMSIHSLEELLLTAHHIRRPAWAIVRTMIHRQAVRTRSLSTNRLNERLAWSEPRANENRGEHSLPYDIEDPKDFIRMLQDWEQVNGHRGETGENETRSPLYLLRSIIYRTEQQNQLSFVGKTAFDSRSTAPLASQYLSVARELESLLGSETAEEDSSFGAGDAEMESQLRNVP